MFVFRPGFPFGAKNLNFQAAATFLGFCGCDSDFELNFPRNIKTHYADLSSLGYAE